MPPPWAPFSTSPGSKQSSVRTPPDQAQRRNGYFLIPHKGQNTSQDRSSPGETNLLAGPSVDHERVRPHTRSLSQTLPSLFGGSKTRAGPNNDVHASPTNQESIAVQDPSPRKRFGRPAIDENDQEVGRCATCDSKARWLRGLPEYRCQACSMINIVKPVIQDSYTASEGDQAGIHRSGTYPPSRHHVFSTAPINVDRTASLEARCVDAYLEARKFQLAARNSRTTPALPQKSAPDVSSTTHEQSGTIKRKPIALQKSPSFGLQIQQSLTELPESASVSLLQGTDHLPRGSKGQTSLNGKASAVTGRTLEIGQGLAHNSPNTSMAQPPRRPPPPPPPSFDTNPETLAQSLNPNETPYSFIDAGSLLQEGAFQFPQEKATDSRQQMLKAIFQPLEEYVMESFGQWECLNTSFTTFKPRAIPIHAERQVKPTHKPEVIVDRLPEPILSELDAKTLLLGDVAENGLWWTGRGDRKEPISHRSRVEQTSASHQLVHTKSPRINWSEVQHWYKIVCSAGNDWRDRWYKLLESMDTTSFSAQSIAEETANIERSLVEARKHLQRMLLKACETLLRRPGRSLKEPSQIRFLLILLANPLLGPNHAHTSSSIQSQMLRPPAHEQWSEGVKTHAKKGTLTRLDSGKTSDSAASFAVLKRILGLLSNLSNECHRHLSAWFARYPKELFRAHVDLLQAFITHRLKRNSGRKRSGSHNDLNELVPNLSGTGQETSAELHIALGLSSRPKTGGIDGLKGQAPAYSDDWQTKAAARVLALLWSANRNFQGDKVESEKLKLDVAISRHRLKHHDQLLSTTDFYNNMVELSDLIADFDTWEAAQGRFCFCQYPFLISVGAKIRILEHDARRQMEVKAREAFFNSILKNQTLDRHLILRVRRDCLAEDSLKSISEVVGAGQEDIKKGLRIQFIDEEGVDAGGLRKEWFLLLVREIFDPQKGMFTYDEDSHFCYFNPFSFEPSEQFFLVGALLGLAIYNSTILDIALPPFLFKKLLAAGPSQINQHANSNNRVIATYTLDDLAEYRPSLAKGLKTLLEFEGNVEETFCRDFVAESSRYGQSHLTPLCPNGKKRPVTNSNRQEFVDLYIRYLLDKSVARQFEPFKRGFYTVCGGNALSLFQPEEIELLVRGSDEPLDVPTLKAVAVYENWRRGQVDIENPAEEVDHIRWFWEFLETAEAGNQRMMLGFITGSDRIPATGASNLIIKIAYGGKDYTRYPIARTCFNQLIIYRYRSREEMLEKLWRAVTDSEGFGLK